ncbi:MAG TPA: ABC transporter ATP-binding protein, partial [Dehalococcoidia bacterium]|nr:ABC transporter ATP-binding protein [Dehalococcoidia bacterium]
RVASLLEVGTGFHPELTGRENTFLNGAILGMTRREIAAKFDEIVAFAEVDKFIDTPVKRYSSGMYVRLAFAVAAHLEPEILLVDEVLAVGDVEFQKKCLSKMDDVAKGGRTVLFVSHNMGAVRALCETGVFLDGGQLVRKGGVAEAVDAYLGAGMVDVDHTPRFEGPDDDEAPVQIAAAQVVGPNGEFAREHPHDVPLRIEVGVRVRERTERVYLAVHIHDGALDTLIFSRDVDVNPDAAGKAWEPGYHGYSVEIPAPLLVPGPYWISLHVVHLPSGPIISRADHVCPFTVVDAGSARARLGLPWRGRVWLPLAWRVVDEPEWK